MTRQQELARDEKNLEKNGRKLSFSQRLSLVERITHHKDCLERAK